MHKKSRFSSIFKAASAIVLTISGHVATASTSYLSGTFSNDDDITWTDFTLAKNTFVNARSTSFGQGGFAPVLSLFALGDNQGLLQIVTGSNNTCATPGAGVASGALCWDAFFSANLDAGIYRLVFSQDGNTPNGPNLADGFAQTGRPSYTGLDYLGDDTRSFVNPDGSQRTGAYAVSLQIGSAVPEPASISLLLVGLVGIAGMSHRTKKSHHFS